MAAPISIPDYYKTVLNAGRLLPWVKMADSYHPAAIMTLSTPAVFLSIKGWTPGKSQTTGQLSIDLKGELLVVCDRTASFVILPPEVFVQSCAAELTQWISGQQFGLEGVDPATFTSAAPYSSEANSGNLPQTGYVGWSVNFTQAVLVGADPYASTGMPLKQAWLGTSPDTGCVHVSDYQLVYGKEDAKNG